MYPQVPTGGGSNGPGDPKNGGGVGGGSAGFPPNQGGGNGGGGMSLPIIGGGGSAVGGQIGRPPPAMPFAYPQIKPVHLSCSHL